ncbi:MAG: hypothetical protein IJ111_09250 [Eggerthellaceae bacterium]|nr:hypothetical protein [Eggerthellaceae bacterium]
MAAMFEGKLTKLALGLLVVIAVALGLTLGAGFEKALADDAGGSNLAAAEMQVADVAYPLWVGEEQVTSDNLEGQGWVFAPAANGNPATLTLNGYNYTGAGHVETLQDYDGDWDYLCHAAIFWNDDDMLVIKLEGENNVTVTADSTDTRASEGIADEEDAGADEDDEGEEDEDPYHRYHGIFCAGNLTLTGTGSLAANGGDMVDGVAGIYAKGNMSIEEGSISAVSYESGICSYEGTIAIGANAGTVAADTTGGIDSMYGIYAEGGDVVIEGGTVAARGYRGISAGSDITINGGEVSAQCTVAATSVLVTTGIASEHGTLTVNGGTVVAKGHQYGIYAEHFAEEGETELVDGIVINGGDVVTESAGSESSGIGINGCTMAVKGGSVRAIGSGDKAFGVSAINSSGESNRGSLVIGEGVASFIAQGPAGAINADTSVTNAVPGFGYADVDGTKGETAIAINAEGQVLDGYKRVLFPAAKASATTKPTSKSSTAKTGDAVGHALPIAAALTALAASALALAARRRMRRNR